MLQGTAHDEGATARRRLLDRLPVDVRRIDVAGVDTSVVEGGQGPPLVLLHGATAGAGLVWWRVVAALADRHRIVVPDLPGFGESAPIDRLDAATVGDWLARLVALTCPEPPTVVAHSNPGSLAARLAAGRSDVFGRLVLVAAPGLGRWRPPSPRFIAAAVRMNLRPSPRSIERFEAGWCYRDLDRIRREDHLGNDAFEAYLLSRGSRPAVKRALRQVIKAGTERVPEAELRSIEVATTMVWGRDDRLVPTTIGEDASARLGWPLHLVADAGHLPHVDRPAAFAETLETALAGIS